MALLELTHTPPVVASLNTELVPWHKVVLPIIGDIGFTNTVVVAVQPAGVL